MSARADRLAAAARERELDAIVVTYLPNVRYLSGYTGTSGLCLIGPEVRAFVTDFRYETQAAEQVPGDFDRQIARGELLTAIGGLLGGGEARLGFDDANMSVKSHARLEHDLGTRVELVAASGVVEALRVDQGRRRGGGDPRGGAARRRSDSSWCSRTGWPGARSRRSRSRWSSRCGGWGRAGRASRRSWPPAPTGRCRTPCRATS